MSVEVVPVLFMGLRFDFVFRLFLELFLPMG